MSSIKFTIKNVSEDATKEGDVIVRFSGKAEPFKHSSEREVSEVGVDGGGKPVLVFNTGLDIEKVDLYRWLNDEEKKVIKKQIQEYLPVIAKAYGGMSVLESTNKFFWKKKREVNKLFLSQETEQLGFDTERASHALLYFSIMGGAFIDIVAPNKEWAQTNNILHYLCLETEENRYDDEEDITRSDAHAALGQLKNEEGIEALFILAWCLQYDTTAYGAYNKTVTPKSLVKYHIQYIDGKLKLKKKRNCPKMFLKYVELWNSPTTRPQVYTEAYVKAGEYFSFLNKKEKKYVSVDGTALGNSIPDVIDNLQKPQFNADYEKLRDLVEAKWKE